MNWAGVGPDSRLTGGLRLAYARQPIREGETMKTPLTGLLLAAAMLPALAAAHVVTLVEPDPRQGILDAEPTQARPRAAQTTTEAECRLDEFTAAEGETLLALIDALPVECMDDWFFDDMPVSRAAVFSEENMDYIIEFVLERAGEYDSAEGRSGLIGKSYVFLHAGYWNYRNHQSLFDDASIRYIRLGVLHAVRAFINNPYFQDEGDEHAAMLSSIAHLAVLANIPHFFFFDFAELFIGRVDAGAYVQSDAEWELLSAILWIIAQSLDHPQVHINYDGSGDWEAPVIRLMESLIEVGVSDRTLDASDADIQDIFYGVSGLLQRSTYNLYDYLAERPALMSEAKANLRRLVNHWDNLKDIGASHHVMFYRAIGIVTARYRRNHTMLTDLMEEFLLKILPHKYACGRHVVRSQAGGREHREEVCNALAYQEALFHSVMDTDEKPVPNDFNESIEVVIFVNDDDYRKSGLVFWNAPSRCTSGAAGHYMELNPNDRHKGTSKNHLVLLS